MAKPNSGKLFLDTETFSTLDLKKVGTYRYAQSCEIMLLSYAIEDGPVQVYDRTADSSIPLDLWDALHDDEMVYVAHKSNFDRNVLRHAWGYHALTPERWLCTMTQALLHGFPGDLDQLCDIFKLPPDKRKLKEGKKLIQRFCKPAPSNHKADRYTRETHPEEWQRFKQYAANDVGAMRLLHRLMPMWNYRRQELRLWHLDQEINDRGFYVDRELLAAGAKAAVDEKETITKRFRELTGINPGQRAKFLEWLRAHPETSDIENTQAETFRALLESGRLPDQTAEVLRLCMQANKTSTAKYASLAPAVNDDNRFRGGLQYSGAPRTRRWAGRLFQPQNLPARGLPPPEDIELYIRALKAQCHDLLFDNLMLYGSAALRGVIVAPPGKALYCSDLSNIEGRDNAWLADERWKLKAFRLFDAGEGPDLYNVTAGSILGKDPYDIGSTERNVFGKVPDLALGYQGGVGALQTFCRVYGVRMADHWTTIQSSLDPQYPARAEHNYADWGHTADLDTEEWLACESVKLAWRGRHPSIVRLWHQTERAAKDAIQNPGLVTQAGKYLKFKRVTVQGFDYLLLALPSGNVICYFRPSIDEDNTIRYWGLLSENGRRLWTRLHTYGGKLVENACQSLARDVMAYNMPAAQEAGFDILLTVHDELVTEADQERGKTPEELSAIMAAVPPWAPGLPLAASGFRAHRYRK